MAREPEDFYSSFISSVQRLPNGNTPVCSGQGVRLFEMRHSGEIVWEWTCDLVPEEEVEEDDPSPVQANSLFRVRLFAPGYPGPQVLPEQVGTD